MKTNKETRIIRKIIRNLYPREYLPLTRPIKVNIFKKRDVWFAIFPFLNITSYSLNKRDLMKNFTDDFIHIYYVFAFEEDNKLYPTAKKLKYKLLKLVKGN